MDDNAQSFSLRGRTYWLNQEMMDILNYAVSYNTTIEIACKALHKKKRHYNWQLPEVELYREYLKVTTHGESFELEKRYIKAKLWNMIDGSGLRIADQLKAMQLLLDMSISGTVQSESPFKNLSFEELQSLLQDINK